MAGASLPRQVHDCNDGTILWPTLLPRQLAALHVSQVFLQSRGWAAFAIEADSVLGPGSGGDWCTVLRILRGASRRAWYQLAWGLTAM
jgi:hypothetical protein